LDSYHRRLHGFFVVAGLLSISALFLQTGAIGLPGIARAEPSSTALEKADGKIPDQYIVVLNEESEQGPRNVADEARRKGASILHVYEHAIKGFAMKVPNDAVLEKIKNDERIAYVEADQVVTAFAQVLPAGIDRVDADSNPTVQAGNGVGSTNVDIAIIDTGIYLSHSDLNVYKHKTYVKGTKTGNDDNGHGTHVAGTAAAKDDGNGVVGMAPGARLWAVKVLDRSGSGSLSNVIKGIDFVTQYAGEIEVANMSLGCECTSTSMNTSIHNSVAAGVTYVVAAGNSAKDASTFSPANHPDVIAVSAIVDTDGKAGGLGSSTSYGADDTFASFSNYGSAVDIAAPGVKIYSTYKGGSYATMSGTSMASPHVAGAAAIYLVNNPEATPSQLVNALQSEGISFGNASYFSGDTDGIHEALLYAANL
jgi:subtilisin family serine protease